MPFVISYLLHQYGDLNRAILSQMCFQSCLYDLHSNVPDGQQIES